MISLELRWELLKSCMLCRKDGQQWTLPRCRKRRFVSIESCAFSASGWQTWVLFSLAVVFPGLLSSVISYIQCFWISGGDGGEKMRQKRTISQEFLNCPLNWCSWFSFFAALFLISLSFSFLFCSWHLHFLEEWKKYISLILNSIYLHKLVRVYDLKDSAVFKVGLFLCLKIISTQYRRVRRETHFLDLSESSTFAGHHFRCGVWTKKLNLYVSPKLFWIHGSAKSSDCNQICSLHGSCHPSQ